LIKVEGIDKILEYIPALQKEIDRALRNAVNATATLAKKEAISRIVGNIGMAKKDVSSRIIATPSTQTDLTAKVSASTRRLPLRYYNPSVTYSGTRGTVTADVSMIRGEQVITGGVFVNPKSGLKKIFRRVGKKAYPIMNATGPSMSHQFERIKPELIALSNENLLTLFETKLQAQIQKRK
jgi:hypothetical protein